MNRRVRDKIFFATLEALPKKNIVNFLLILHIGNKHTVQSNSSRVSSTGGIFFIQINK